MLATIDVVFAYTVLTALMCNQVAQMLATIDVVFAYTVLTALMCNQVAQMLLI